VRVLIRNFAGRPQENGSRLRFAHRIDMPGDVSMFSLRINTSTGAQRVSWRLCYPFLATCDEREA
jgi:hypothetical protein